MLIRVKKSVIKSFAEVLWDNPLKTLIIILVIISYVTGKSTTDEIKIMEKQIAQAGELEIYEDINSIIEKIDVLIVNKLNYRTSLELDSYKYNGAMENLNQLFEIRKKAVATKDKITEERLRLARKANIPSVFHKIMSETYRDIKKDEKLIYDLSKSIDQEFIFYIEKKLQKKIILNNKIGREKDTSMKSLGIKLPYNEVEK